MVVRILSAVVAAFVISSIWYVGFGGLLARLHPAYAGKTAPWVPVAEVARSLVLAVVVAIGCDRLRLAAVHAGDWLLKLVAVALIVGL